MMWNQEYFALVSDGATSDVNDPRTLYLVPDLSSSRLSPIIFSSSSSSSSSRTDAGSAL